VVKALLAYGADVNVRDTERGQTALMWAVAHRHPDVVQVLIEQGTDIQARSKVTQRVVARANRYGGVVSYDRAAAERAVERIPEGGSTSLLFAARSGDLASAALLVAAGANVNDTAPDGMSALVMASHSGHGPLAAFLLEQGADPNHDGAGYTALHAAVLRGDPDLVKALLARGAQPNALLVKGDPQRRYSKDYALNHTWVGATPFWLAARFAEVSTMRALAAGGADPHRAIKDGTTPVIAAVAAGTDSGPSAADRRERRYDPLDLAERVEHHAEYERQTLEAVEVAVELGVDVNGVNAAGETALHHAAAKGFNTIIQFLVNRGARLDVKNKRGQTPLAMATSPAQLADGHDRTSTVDLLRRLGAER
jgi:ankyrin